MNETNGIEPLLLSATTTEERPKPKRRRKAALPQPMTDEADARTAAALRAKMLRVEGAATDRMKGRNAEARLALPALLTGHHALRLGAPGTGKTMLLRFMAAAVNARTCYRACHPWTRERDLIGAINLAALTEGRIERDATGTLLASDVAILDEAFRASDEARAIILSALNERRDPDGRPIPLRTALLAANDPPSEGLAGAFSDRILFRRLVKSVAVTTDAIGKLAKGAKPVASEDFVEVVADLEDLKSARDFVAAVRLPDPVRELAAQVVATFREVAKDAIVSDRRVTWAFGDRDHTGTPIASAVKAAAWIAGRDEAIPTDLWTLADVLWHEPEQVPLLAETLKRLVPSPTDGAARMLNEVLALLSTLSSFGPSAMRLDAVEAVATTLAGMDTTRAIAGADAQVGAQLKDAVEQLTDAIARARSACAAAVKS